MSTQVYAQVTINDLKEVHKRCHPISNDTRLTIIVEERKKVEGKRFHKEEVLKAMEELKGAGNGKLMDALLEDIRREALL